MPDTTETLAMLREAFDLGLLPKGYGQPGLYMDDAGKWELWGCAHVETRCIRWLSDKDKSILCLLLDHLAGRGLRCIHEPPWGAGQHGYWRVQAPYPDGRNALAAGPSDPRWMASEADIHTGGEYPGVLGLLAAAVAAERWRLSREAEVRDATS